MKVSSQNDAYPNSPNSGKMFLPIELYNILLRLDASSKSVSLVNQTTLVKRVGCTI